MSHSNNDNSYSGRNNLKVSQNKQSKRADHNKNTASQVPEREQPRIHLGKLLRTSEDAFTEGQVSELHYEQGDVAQVLRFTEGATYEISINSLGGDEMYLQGFFDPTLIMDCARCLCDVNVSLEIKLGTLMRYEPSVDTPYLEEAESGESLLVFGDPDLDLSAYLAETTLLAAPVSVLHAPDCKGLCQGCGHDLNTGPCQCETSRPVPIEDIEDDLGTPAGSSHAKQSPFAALRDLKLPEDTD